MQTAERFVLVEAPCEIFRKLKVRRDRLESMFLGGLDEMPMIELLRVDNINDIIITHAHGDHCAGLEEIGWYKMFVQKDPIMVDYVKKETDPGRRPNVYALPKVIDDLVARIEATLTRTSGLPPDAFYNFVDVDHSKILFPIAGGAGPVELELLRTYHGLGDGRSTAVVISYAGRTLAYSGDTRFDSNLVKELSHADLMIHECDANGAVHTTAEELAKWLDKNLHVAKKLRVCHYPSAEIPCSKGLRPLEEFGYLDVLKP